MFKLTTKLLTMAAVLTGVSVAVAQDSGPLIDLLVRKGIVNDQEAEELRADLARDAAAAVTATVSGGKSTTGIAISGRIQAQFVNASTDIDGTSSDPTYVNHFILRRVYFGIKANLTNDFSSTLNYDFAGSTFDAAFITWTASPLMSLDVGLRKVPFGYDEWLTSSGKLKGIERSSVTRYFVEGNNGRRLGAGSYRQGVFLNGKDPGGFNYQLAITNPERDEDGISGVGSAGNSTDNDFAYWGQAGYSGKTDSGMTFVFGGSVGYLPDQGGKTLGVGDNLLVTGIYADISSGPFSLSGEFDWSDNEHGASATKDSNSWGWYIQPTYRIGDKIELVARYSYVDSDGRGVSLSDGVRSGPSGGTMKTATDYYVGGNWYFNSWDTVLQAGYIWGESNDKLDGTPAQATVQGLRAQLQVNF